MSNAPYNILTAALAICKDGKQQQAFTRFYNNLKSEGLTDFEVIGRMGGAIFDAYAYGNYPE